MLVTRFVLHGFAKHIRSRMRRRSNSRSQFQGDIFDFENSFRNFVPCTCVLARFWKKLVYSEELFLEMAERLARDGYRDAGYEYLILDGMKQTGWFVKPRTTLLPTCGMAVNRTNLRLFQILTHEKMKSRIRRKKPHLEIHPNWKSVGPRVKMADCEGFCPLTARLTEQCSFKGLKVDSIDNLIFI